MLMLVFIPTLFVLVLLVIPASAFGSESGSELPEPTPAPALTPTPQPQQQQNCEAMGMQTAESGECQDIDISGLLPNLNTQCRSGSVKCCDRVSGFDVPITGCTGQLEFGNTGNTQDKDEKIEGLDNDGDGGDSEENTVNIDKGEGGDSEDNKQGDMPKEHESESKSEGSESTEE